MAADEGRSQLSLIDPALLRNSLTLFQLRRHLFLCLGSR